MSSMTYRLLTRRCVRISLRAARSAVSSFRTDMLRVIRNTIQTCHQEEPLYGTKEMRKRHSTIARQKHGCKTKKVCMQDVLGTYSPDVFGRRENSELSAIPGKSFSSARIPARSLCRGMQKRPKSRPARVQQGEGSGRAWVKPDEW